MGQIDRMNGIETGVVRIGTFASVAINGLPNIFAVLQKDYPGIEYEMLLGDYDEVEHWIDEGRVDCGFLRLPTLPKFDTLLLKQDEYKAVLPMGHPLAAKETVAVEELDGLPFLLLEHGGKTEVSDLLERTYVQPDVRFTTWEDFAIMAMVEKGLGVSILPDLIFAAHPLSDRGAPLATAVLPSDRSGDETAGASDACCAKIHRISPAAGSAALSGAGTAAENR